MKNFYRESLFVESGLYVCLAFFSFGLMSVFPQSLRLHPSILVSGAKPSDTITVERTNKDIDERCRLQADVTLFLSMQEQKENVSRTAVPCEKKAQVPAEMTGKAAGHPDGILENTVREMVIGYPIEKMAPAIAGYDREVAALIVGIAKKESDWGKYSPRDQSGADCFNYWGYKGAGSRGIAMGHGCFGSPEEAVAAVGDRLVRLVALYQTSEPKNMIVWKCGSSCQGHSAESVKKWISDVALYYHRIAEK